jgi:hypothetical protein
MKLFNLALVALMLLHSSLSAIGAEQNNTKNEGAVAKISLRTFDSLVETGAIVLEQNGSAIRVDTVRNDKTAGYNVVKTLHYKGKVSPVQFNRLVALMDSIRFFELRDGYTSFDWTPSYRTTVIKNDTTKSVMNRNGEDAPIELWAFEMAILSVANDIKWELAETKSVVGKTDLIE